MDSTGEVKSGGDKDTTTDCKSIFDSRDEITSGPKDSHVKSADHVDSKPRSAPPKGRGYQENRRYDRERRVKRTERKSDDKVSTADSDLKPTEQNEDAVEFTKSGSPATPKGKSFQKPSNTKSGGSSTKYESRSKDYKDGKGGRKGDSGAKEYRRGSGSGTYSRNGSGNKEGKTSEKGTDLLNLLQKESKNVDTKSTKGSSDKGKLGKEMKSKSKSAADLEAQWQKEEQERKAKEEEERKKEEERRKEEERIRLEEEKRQQEEEEARRLKEEEIKTIQDFVQDVAERLKWKEELRLINRNAAENRPDDSFFTKLDSSLKKNTAFVKKLKNMTESQKEILTKDINALNLTKYIGEVAAAITEAKLKMTDIRCALHLCSLLHQRYADFAPTLMENWNKVLLTKKDEKVPNPSKLRVDLRFFADLISVGVFTLKEGLPSLANQLTLLISNDKDDHNNLTIILSFCKHCGDDYAGLLPRKYKLLAEKYEFEVTRSTMLPAERQKACRGLLRDYFTSLSKHLENNHKQLKYMERQNRKILQTKGELSQERKDQQESAIQAFQKLLTNAQSFSDLMDETLPDLPEEEYKSETDQMGCDIYHPMKAEYEYSGDSTLFEDEDTRQFYENIPDLKAIIPGILYKDSEFVTRTDNTEPEVSADDDLQDLDVEELEKVLQMELDIHEESQLPEGGDDKMKDDADDEAPAAEHMEDAEGSAEKDDDDGDIAGSMKLMLEAFLSSLPNCVNRELIDRAATDFCMNMNTKVNRKKLVKALFTVQRTRYDLLPFYARFVATLHPCMPDVAVDLVSLLKSDFKWHVRKKDQINIESKIKSVRFIGELVKFGMFPKSESLHCMKMLMFDFTHHNIEMACSLLETCGRFLFRSPDSHHRTKVYLDVMMRKKAALHFNQRYDTMIENAYYYSNPPETKQEAKKVRPPMHEYIRKLLYKDLSKITTEKVLRQMRKLLWEDLDARLYTIKCLIAVWNLRYNSVHCCANLLAGLALYHEDVAIDVVDGILEDIRIGMEINHPKYNQRRVSCVKYLGELYNYRMVESSVIFKTLYLFITFGVSLDENIPSPLDPPEHLFRLRLTCVLLDACGQYFDRGSSKKKLDYFIAYFLRYFQFKRGCSVWTSDHPFPIDIDYTIHDTLEVLRPKLKLPETYEEAAGNVEAMEKELLAKIADVLPKLKLGEETGTESEQEGALTTIFESEEADDISQGLSQVQLTADDTQDSDREQDDATGSQNTNEMRKLHHADDAGEEGEGQVEVEEAESSDLEDVLDSAGEEESEDQVTVLTGGPKHMTCPEDEDFMAAFDKILTDTIQARSQEAVKLPQVEITMPVNIKQVKKPKPPAVSFLGIAPQEKEEEEEEEETDDSMKFTLMTRKGTKSQFATLNIPVSENFASKFKEREEAVRAEKERIKQVVLDIHERQEEEDYQEMIALMSRPAMVTLNREKKMRYQHPKGAPDADLIFGSKKH